MLFFDDVHAVIRRYFSVCGAGRLSHECHIIKMASRGCFFNYSCFTISSPSPVFLSESSTSNAYQITINYLE